MATITTNHGVGFAVNNVLSLVEGLFAVGFVLGTNLTLDVQTVIQTAVARNTPYSLSYTDPATGQLKTYSILHDPGLPYSPPVRMPEGVPITLTVPESALYQALTESITIEPGASPIMRPRLQFKNSYATISRKRYYR